MTSNINLTAMLTTTRTHQVQTVTTSTDSPKWEYSETTERGTGTGGKKSTIAKRILNRQVVYPIFETCAEYTNDEFWKSKLILAARDRFPRSFNYRDGFLSHKLRGRTSSVKIPEDNPGEALRIFIGFMNDRGVFSDMDTENYKAMIDYAGTVNEITSPETWTQVGTRTRDNYIEEFISRVTVGLSSNAVTSLRHVIYTGVKLKVLDKTRIHMGYFRIESIDGIVYNPNNDTFIIHPDIWNATLNIKPKSGSSITNTSSLESPIKHFQYSGVDYIAIWGKKLDGFSKSANSGIKTIPTFMFGPSVEVQSPEQKLDIPSAPVRPMLTIV